MNDKKFKVLIVVIIKIILMFVLSIPIMFLWNWLMPIIGLGKLNYIQIVCMNLLIYLLKDPINIKL